MEKAIVFLSGTDQAIRIPAQFRFTSNEVYLRRDAINGDVIPTQNPIAQSLVILQGICVPEDFLSPKERAQTLPQERLEV